MNLTIAILGPTLRPKDSASVGGVAVHTAALAEALRRSGARVVILSDSTYADERASGILGVRGAPAARLVREMTCHPLVAAAVLWRSATSPRRRRLGLSLRSTFSRALLIRRALDTVRPDVIHIQQADFRPLYLQLAGSSAPVVTMVHGLGGLETGEYPELRTLIPEHLSLADAVVTPSHALLGEVRALQPTIDDARVIPNAIDHVRFRPSDVDAARRSVGLDGLPGPILLYAGRITEHKGATDLLAAFESVQHQYPDARLVMLGPWVLDSPPPGPGSGVMIVDAVPQETMSTWFNAATLTVVPSRYEGFGLVALESMACGTPVLATEVGGLPEVVDPRAGVLVQPRSPEALADAALSLLGDPMRLSRMSDLAVDVAAGYSWDATAAAFLSLYRDVCNGGGAAGTS